MTRPSLRPARPVLFLLTLALTVACTSAPAAAQSPAAPTAGGAPTGSTSPATPPGSASATVAGAGGGTGSGGSTGGNVGGGSGSTGSGSTTPGGVGGSGPIVVDPTVPVPPVTSGPVGPNPVVPDDGWKAVGATPGLKDLRPQAWDHISISPDGKTMTVYFWSGVETCYGLSEVRVTRQGGVPTITVITGTRDLPTDTACIDLAQGFKTTVTLDEPIVLDGSPTVQP